LCKIIEFSTIYTFHIDPGEVTYVRDAVTTSDLIKRNDVDAIEIHTSAR